MATPNYWLDAGAGDLTAAASWSTGAEPANGETLVFRAGSSQSVVTNLDGLADAGKHFTAIIVEAGCAINIGGSGAPLQASATTITHMGSGEFWFSDASTTTTTETGTIILQGATPGTPMNVTGDALNDIEVRRGTLTIPAGAPAIDNLWVHYVDNPATDANVTITAGAGTITNAIQTGGRVESDSLVTNGTFAGGEWLQDTTHIVNITVCGGSLVYMDATATGDNVTIHGLSGLLDLSQGGRYQDFDNVMLWPACRAIRNESLLNINTKEKLIGDATFWNPKSGSAPKK